MMIVLIIDEIKQNKQNKIRKCANSPRFNYGFIVDCSQLILMKDCNIGERCVYIHKWGTAEPVLIISYYLPSVTLVKYLWLLHDNAVCHPQNNSRVNTTIRNPRALRFTVAFILRILCWPYCRWLKAVWIRQLIIWVDPFLFHIIWIYIFSNLLPN